MSEVLLELENVI